MGFLTSSSSSKSWHPEPTSDTTTSTYWLNWKVGLSSIWILISIVIASFLISRYEGPGQQQNTETSDGKSSQHDHNQIRIEAGIVYEDEVWKPCLRGMHPAWLLGYRVCSFIVLLCLLVLNVSVDGRTIMYYYTQWTFALVTIYFGLGSVLSMYGCCKVGTTTAMVGDEWMLAEEGSSNLNPMPNPNANAELKLNSKSLNFRGIEADYPRKIAGFWGYSFQIIYQMNAGAVMLTDCVFWLIILPFLVTNKYDINFLLINMHTINAVFLLGDTAMNCLRFPWFRMAYFLLWTCFYAIFQWIVHASLYIWWPYPFLDLSNSLSPLWYSMMAITHFPCFGLFILVIKFKHSILSNYFPDSYQCATR